MRTVFYLNHDELDMNFLKILNNLFHSKKIKIDVDDEFDPEEETSRNDTEYLMSSEKNHKILSQRLKNIERGKNLKILKQKEFDEISRV